MRRKIGELLKEAGYIDDVQLAVALGMQRKTGLKVGSQLLKLGFVGENGLSRVLRAQLGIKVSLAEASIPREAIRAVPQSVAFKYKVVPMDYDGKTVRLAMENPSDLQLLDDIAFEVG